MSNKTVLDVGTGTGQYARRFLNRGSAQRAVGVDFSKNMLREGRLNARNIENLNVLAMDGCKLGFRDQTFDIVTAIGLLEYVQDPSPFLKEFHRVLKPGGKILLTLHNKRFGSLTGLFASDLQWERSYYSKDKIDSHLTDNGFRLQKTTTTMFFHHSFWIPFKIMERLGLHTLTSIWTTVFSVTEQLLRKLPLLEEMGKEWIVLAEKRNHQHD
ncbi:MAG: class I SAM-dependent methyltransferase [bacterium]